MDETDVRLCQMLFANSRIPVREMADNLNISVQATHRRMQILKEEGLVDRFKASLSIGYLHAIRVLIEGISQGEPEEVEKALRKNEFVHSVFIGEGQPQYFLECIIRDIKELDVLVRYLRKKAGISNPNVLFDTSVQFGKQILDTGYTGPDELSRLDYRMIDALNDDARMSIGDLALRCGTSARTVTRHLDRLIGDGAIDFSIEWRPGMASGLTAMMAVVLHEDADPQKVSQGLGHEFGGSLFMIATLSNIAGLISCYAWSPSIRKYNELLNAIGKCDGVKAIQSAVLKDGWIQDTWRDGLLKERAKTKN